MCTRLTQSFGQSASTHSVSKMMTTTMVLARASDESKVKEDLNKVRDYIKEDLFYRVIFIWDDGQLKEGSVLHGDFIERCKPLLANGDLLEAEQAAADAYLKYLWTTMLKDKCYREWLGLKRSNAYQAVQDKFMSKCHATGS